MTSEEEIQAKIKKECEPSIKQAAGAALIGAVGGAVVSVPNVPAMIINGARGAAGAFVENAATQGIARGECVDKIKEAVKQEPKKESSPPPVVFTPKKPVNVNANYAVQMQANRNRIMFRGSMRI